MFFEAISNLDTMFSSGNLIFLLIGAIVGLVFGVLPGLGGPQVLALLLPVTIGMDPHIAMTLLISAAAAVPFGGSISAILINTPGTAQSAATTIDGFPLTRQGNAGLAIGASGVASALGGILGAIVLTAILPVGRQIVLAFSFPEYFAIAVLGLSVIAVITRGSVWKGLIAALLGLIISTIGYDPVTGSIRYVFGISYLYEGIKIVPAFIGLFAISQSITLVLEGTPIVKIDKKGNNLRDILKGGIEVFKHPRIFFQSSFIGTLIGLVPGVGGTVANFISYIAGKNTIKNNNFGKGDIRGVIAPEAANNAKEGGALVPTLVFGIPGSLEMAILLGALMVHGIAPGPLLMIENKDMVLTIIYILVLGSIAATLVGLAASNLLVNAVKVPGSFVAIIVFVLSLIGSYATNNIYYDMLIALMFGVIGYYMKKYNYSIIAFVLGMVLGRITEQNLYRTLMSSGPSGFFTSPISLILLIASLIIILIPFISRKTDEVQ